MGQLGFSFLWGEGSTNWGTRPPDPLGFIALGLLPERLGFKCRRTVASPPALTLSGHKPPERRSGRIPALPYPPLEHTKTSVVSRK